MSVILDASALLAVLLDEPGGEVVSPLAKGSQLLAVNYCEVVQRLIAIVGDVGLAELEIERLEIAVVPFDRSLARVAAELRAGTKFIGASLADRACLALGLATGLPILSADQNWLKLDLGLDIRMIR